MHCLSNVTAVIVWQLKERTYPVLRPHVFIDDGNTQWLDIVESCWSEVPSQRPTAAAVKRTVKKLAQLK